MHPILLTLIMIVLLLSMYGDPTIYLKKTRPTLSVLSLTTTNQLIIRFRHCCKVEILITLFFLMTLNGVDLTLLFFLIA